MSSLFLSSNLTNDKTDNNANHDFFSKSMNQSENLSSKYEKYKNQLLNTSPQSMLFSTNNDSTSTISELKKLYDERIISLYNNIRVTTLQLQTDDLLSTMRNDITTSQNSEFIISRTKEIIDDEFYSEKEKTISKLIEENAALRATLSDTMRDKNIYNDEYINKLKEMNIAQDIKIKQNEKTISEQKEHINELLNENSQIGNQSKNEIERLNKVINVIEIDLATAEQSQREQNETISSLTKQLNDSALLIRKHIEEGKSKQKLIEQYEKERVDIMNKYGMIEKNLGDEKEKNEVIKEKYSSMYNEMQNGMKSLSEEWERRNKKIQSEYEKIINEIERKNKNEIESLKNKHEMENMRNISEIKDLKVKNEQFRTIATRYIKIDEHERIIHDKIKEEKEKMSNEIKAQSSLFENEFKSKLQSLSEEKRKEINDINLKYKNKIEQIENDNENLKKMINDINIEKEYVTDNIKKLQIINEDKEKENQNLSEIIIERNNENSIMKTEINSLKDEIENQKDKINSLLQQYKLCEDNLNKYKEDKNSQKEIITQNENKIEILEKKLNEINFVKSDKEKEIFNLEKKLKEQQNFYKNIIDECFEKNEKIKNYLSSTIKMLKYQIKSFNDYTKNEIESIKKETENKMKLFISKIANILSIYVKEKKEKEKLFEDTKSNYNSQISTLQSILNTALNSIKESKSEFISEINSIKSECEKLNKCHIEEIASKEKKFKSQLSKIENDLKEAQFENEKMQRDIKNKVSSLNQKEEQIKTLTNKLMEQTDQIFKYKKETEQIIANKDNKISQLQNVVNQSLHSLNKGVNSVQIANQLDSEVKELIRTAKRNSLNDSLSEIKIPSINSK